MNYTNAFALETGAVSNLFLRPAYSIGAERRRTEVPSAISGRNGRWNVTKEQDSSVVHFIFMTIAPLSISRENAAISHRIRQLHTLQDNWDGEGAVAPSRSLIFRALRMVGDIDHNGVNVRYCSLGPEGEISLEMKQESRELEIILYDDGGDTYVQYENRVSIDDGDFEKQMLSPLLQWLNTGR